MTTPATRSGSLAVLVAQLVSLGWFAAALSTTRGFPLDDAWIHQVIARNLPTSGTLGFLPGVPFSGSTSPVWSLLLTINYCWLHVDPVIYTSALNAALFLVFGQMLFRLAIADGLATRHAVLIAALASLGGNFVWLAFSGMEAVAFAALSLVAIFLWFEMDARGWGKTALAGTVLSLLIVTRPEGIVLGPTLAIFSLRTHSVPRPAIVRALGVFAFGMAALVLTDVIIRRPLLPGTLGGRQWAGGIDRIGVTSAVVFAGQLAAHLTRFTVGAGPIVFAITAFFAAAGVARLLQCRCRRLTALWCSIGVLLLVYAIVLPVVRHGGRYQPLLLAMFLPIAGYGASAIVGVLSGVLDSRFTRRWRIAEAFAVTPFIAAAIVSMYRWSGTARADIEHINRTERAMGRWIGEHLPASARISSFDIGGVTFDSHRAIIDLGGLVSPEYLTYLRSGRIVDYLRAHEIEHVVLPTGIDDTVPDQWNIGFTLGLYGREDVHLTRVVECAGPTEPWQTYVKPMALAAPRQVLYRVTYGLDVGRLPP